MLLQLRQGNYAPAVRTALECLRTFGVDLPDSPTPEQMWAEYEEMRRTLGERPIESLVDLPMMDDPEMRAVMKLFSALGELAYHADGDLFQMISCWMVKLTVAMAQASTPRSATARSPWFLVRHSIASQTGRPLHGWRSQSPNDTGSARKKAGAHFLMQMAVLWTRPIEDA
jgi:Predicted ATPase